MHKMMKKLFAVPIEESDKVQLSYEAMLVTEKRMPVM